MNIKLSTRDVLMRDIFLVILLIWVGSTVTEEMVTGFISGVFYLDLIDGLLLIGVGMMLFSAHHGHATYSQTRSEKFVHLLVILAVFLLVFVRARIISTSLGAVFALLAASVVAIYPLLVSSSEYSQDTKN